MIFKKIILTSSIIFILIILFTILGCCFFFRQNNYKVPVVQECPQIKYIETKPTEETFNSETTEGWNTYYDERYKYKVDFPAGLNVTTTYEDIFELPDDFGGGFLTINGGVNFATTDFFGIISVEIFENSKFHSLDEWLESEKNEYVSRVVEKRINIDGNEAIVTYQVSMVDGKIWEEFKREKETVFIKDNKLFVLFTRLEDHEKVWNSFKFITGDYPIH